MQKYTVNIFDDKGTEYGSVQYTTVGAIPSNVKEKRVWELNLTGYLKPNTDKYSILYDFADVDYKGNIRFENVPSGTFNICGQVLDANKIMNFSYSDDKSTLTIEIDTKKWDFRINKLVEFSYCVNLDDSSTCSSLKYNSSAIEVENGSCVNTSISSIQNSTIKYSTAITSSSSQSQTITLTTNDSEDTGTVTLSPGDSESVIITGLSSVPFAAEIFKFSNNSSNTKITMEFTDYCSTLSYNNGISLPYPATDLCFIAIVDIKKFDDKTGTFTSTEVKLGL